MLDFCEMIGDWFGAKVVIVWFGRFLFFGGPKVIEAGFKRIVNILVVLLFKKVPGAAADQEEGLGVGQDGLD